MDVLLDLWGVLTDSRRMIPAYRAWLAENLCARYGGSADAWGRAHDHALAWYEDLLRRPETWSQGSWTEVVDRADAENLVRMFREVGADPPKEPLALARALEFDGMSRVDTAFPDARNAVGRLRKAGHRVFVTTGATESNGRGALAGARLLDAVDGVFTGQLLDAGKVGPAYWKAVYDRLGRATPKAVVDDRLDYLAAAVPFGGSILLMDRERRHAAGPYPPYVRAVLRHLAGLPHLVEVLAKEADEGPS